MNKYLLTLYCFLDDKLKECQKNNKYNYHKSISVFYLDIYNDKHFKNRSIVERFSGTLRDFKIKNLCDININNIDFNDTKNYKLLKIKTKILENDNSYKYHYNVSYNANNINKNLIIESDILKSNSIFKLSKEIKEILLVYTILGLDTGNFWGVIPNVYKYIANLYNNNIIECFASPFNHTLTNYYSVVKTDKKYGSKGNFFKRFLKDDYKCYVINPPFTEEIMNKVFDMIKIKLMKHKCSIYLYIPSWEDMTLPFYEDIKKNYTIFMHKWGKNESYVFNYTNNKKILATFDLTLFYITNITDGNTDGYNQFIKMMSI